MNKPEQINQEQVIAPKSIEDKIFGLEEQIDLRKAFILANKENSLTSESMRNRIDSFEKEIKDFNLQLIKARLQLRELNGE